MSDEKNEESNAKKSKIAPNEVGKDKKVLSAEEQKRLLFSKTDAKSNSKGTDEILDRLNERAGLVSDPAHGEIVGGLKPYDPTFPKRFYANLFRLLGLKIYDENFQRKPMIFASITLTLIYLRFPYGTLKKLRRLNPKINGKRLFKYFQLLTALGEIGLMQFLSEANDLMDTCTHYDEFIRRFSQQYDKPWQGHLFDKA